MQREEALALLKKNVKNKNLQKHCLAMEAVMRRLAEYFNEDVELWGLAGLLHDIDYDRTKDDPARHSIEGAQMLEELGLPEEVVYAVKVHNDYHGLPRKSLLDKALYAADPMTGFIVAAALIRPEKKLAAVDVDFLMKRFKEKAFARGARREPMKGCKEELGLSLEEFLGLGLEAMQKNAEVLGL
ncbi:MAG: HDIG domain-containing protein [Peptococcaceae bacterium]|nr:HDIG domain-containing protein [Peptococcaceae bacterium]